MRLSVPKYVRPFWHLMCTLHANSADEVLAKMCTLPLLAGEHIRRMSAFAPSW